ncbi:MAG: hypothetical protein GX495_12605 [Chloroflexi bacterium]|nr:hypothetical protein [Chloroflexota bacterium]
MVRSRFSGYILLVMIFLAGCSAAGPQVAAPTENAALPHQENAAQHGAEDSSEGELLAGLAAPGQAASREFSKQAGTPAYIPNIARPEVGCNWTGVGGQVFDMSGKAVDKIVVEVEGTLGGKPVLATGMTGTNKNLGPGGFDVTLADQPLASSAGALTVQLKDLNGNPISEKVAFQTSADCSKNLVLINFKEVPVGKVHLPMLVR